MRPLLQFGGLEQILAALITQQGRKKHHPQRTVTGVNRTFARQPLVVEAGVDPPLQNPHAVGHPFFVAGTVLKKEADDSGGAEHHPVVVVDVVPPCLRFVRLLERLIDIAGGGIRNQLLLLRRELVEEEETADRQPVQELAAFTDQPAGELFVVDRKIPAGADDQLHRLLRIFPVAGDHVAVTKPLHPVGEGGPEIPERVLISPVRPHLGHHRRKHRPVRLIQDAFHLRVRRDLLFQRLVRPEQFRRRRPGGTAEQRRRQHQPYFFHRIIPTQNLNRLPCASHMPSNFISVISPVSESTHMNRLRFRTSFGRLLTTLSASVSVLKFPPCRGVSAA